MSHKNKKTLKEQIDVNLQSKMRIGESKHKAKKTDEHLNWIYSYYTYHDYTKSCYNLADFCRKNFHCKTLEQCHEHVNDWLQYLIDKGYSASTIAAYKCGVAKLYDESSTKYIATPTRHRADITRSRGPKVRDKHFSEKNHAEFVAFCKSCGLRPHELKNLLGKDLICNKKGNYFVYVNKGKGGKKRYARVIGDVENVKAVFASVGSEEHVFKKLPNGADIYGYRHDYAQALYEMYARPIETIPEKEKYRCRKDKHGIIYDRIAMKFASVRLGHNRIDVIALNYLD